MMPTESTIAPNRNQTGQWGVIKVAGQDRRSFLQGQLTQDVYRLEPGTALLAGWASSKGRLLCIACLFEWGDADWLVVPAELVESIAKKLRMYVLRADVSIATDVAVARVARTVDLAEIAYNECNKTQINVCFSERYAAIIFSDSSELALTVSADGQTGAAVPELEQAWRLAMINSGRPIIWQATSEEFVPQMVNLDLLDGISFKKGCYVGQEIVARTQNLGRIKRRMYAFIAQADASIKPGCSVFSRDQVVGQVVDAVPAEGQLRLLAVVRIDNISDDLSLDPQGKIRLVGRPLPYAVPENPGN